MHINAEQGDSVVKPISTNYPGDKEDDTTDVVA